MESLIQTVKNHALEEAPLMNDRENIPNVEILSAKPEDARGIRELEYETWMATYPSEESKITRGDIEWYFKTFKKSYSPKSIEKLALEIKGMSDDQYAVVAKNESGKVIGFAWLIKKDTANELGSIYVHPEYQGMNLGKKLWKEAISFFDPQKETDLTVQENNFKAIEFYKKLGFVDAGKLVSAITFPSGANFNEIKMTRGSTLIPPL